MPLIQIDLDRELFDSLGDQLSAAVHKAQLDALDIPSDDLFQVFTPHGAGRAPLRPRLQRGRPATPRPAPHHDGAHVQRRHEAAAVPGHRRSGSPRPAYAPRTS